MYIVNVKTENAKDGCFSKSFEHLNEETKAWIRQSAESFRKCRKDAKCSAVILKSGSALKDAKILEV